MDILFVVNLLVVNLDVLKGCVVKSGAPCVVNPGADVNPPLVNSLVVISLLVTGTVVNSLLVIGTPGADVNPLLVNSLVVNSALVNG